MPDEALTLFAAGDADTTRFGNLLAKFVVPGDLILLQGELGVGKSALARATIRALFGQAKLEVPSPTYLLVLPYEGQNEGQHWSVLHVDLYRINAPEELDELGLFGDPQTIVMIEWPERVPHLFDQADLLISLRIPSNGNGRTITIRSGREPRNLAALSRGFEEGE